MTLTIDLPPEIETQLQEIAAREGQDPASFAKAAVEEKLRRAVQSAPVNGAISNGTPPNNSPSHEQTDKPMMLDEALAGLTGVVNIGPSDLAARSEEAFADIMDEKFPKFPKPGPDA